MLGPIRPLFLILTLGLACLANAQNVVGKYNGKMFFNREEIPKNLSKEQLAQVEASLKELDKMKLTLTISKDKTFKLVSTGGPRGMTNSSGGTWTLSGTNLEFTFKTVNEKPSPKSEKQTLTVSEGGKTLTMRPNNSKSRVVFTRA
jgi:hypothetical protein